MCYLYMDIFIKCFFVFLLEIKKKHGDSLSLILKSTFWKIMGNLKHAVKLREWSVAGNLLILWNGELSVECLIFCWLCSSNLKMIIAGLNPKENTWLDWPEILSRGRAWNQGSQIQGTKERVLLEGKARKHTPEPGSDGCIK